MLLLVSLAQLYMCSYGRGLSCEVNAAPSRRSLLTTWRRPRLGAALTYQGVG